MGGFLRLVRGVLIVAAALYVASFIAVLLVSRRDQRHPAEAIVVLGAAQYNGKPSPVFRARLDHAITLWKEGLSPRIVVTGGQATGDRESEAAVGARYLIAQGVPEAATAGVPVGHDTQGSMVAVANWMHERALESALLVSDPFHLLRLRLEASDVGLTAWTSPTTTSPISANRRREAGFLAGEALKVPVALVRSLGGSPR